MNPKAITTGMLTPAIKMQAEKVHGRVINGKLKEAEEELNNMVAMATELSRRIRKTESGGK